MEVYKNYLVFPLDYKSKIAFLSLEDANKSWTFDIDWKFPLNNIKPRMFLSKTEDETSQGKNKKKNP